MRRKLIVGAFFTALLVLALLGFVLRLGSSSATA